MPADKDDWLDDLEEASPASSGGPDQSDTRALFTEDGQVPAPSPAAGSAPETDDLEQSAIDALLSGGGQGEAPVAPDAAGGELDQSDIDALLVSPQAPAQAKEAADPDQDEIDKLFSEADSIDAATEVPFPEAEADFKDIFDSPEPVGQAPAAVLDFNSDEFNLGDDIPDIPDSIGIAAPLEPPREDEPTAAGEPPPAAAPALAEETTVSAATPPTAVGAAALALLLANRKLLLVAGAGLLALLLLVGGGLLLVRHRAAPESAQQQEVKPPPPPSAPAPPPPAQEVAAPQALTTPAPVIGDLELTMPAASKELPVTLNASDSENKELHYEFLSMPAHGQLSGNAPNLTYAPNPAFSGQDSFSVKVSNGTRESAPATIRITRLPAVPAVVSSPPSPPEKEKPAGGEAGIRAADATYIVTGGKGRRIDWKRLWRTANRTPARPEVRVDILKPPRHGDVRLKGMTAVYRPTPGFAGADTIRYRFRLGARLSEVGRLTMKVERQRRPPVIRLQPLAPEYETGDTVSLNASQTTAGRPGLIFSWEQQSGPPVRLRALNEEGSRVDFVAPAFFNTVANPRLSFLLTVTAPDGLTASREVSVGVKSRRNSAIWGGGR